VRARFSDNGAAEHDDRPHQEGTRMGVDRIDGSSVGRWGTIPEHNDAPPAPPPSASRRTTVAPPPPPPLPSHSGPPLSPDAFNNPALKGKAHEKAKHEQKTIASAHKDTLRPATRERVYTTNPAEQSVHTTRLDAARDVYPAIGKLVPGLSKEARFLLTAQFVHETGGGASCFNFNLGNVKAAPGLKEPHMYLANNKEVVSSRELARLTNDKTPFHECVHLVATKKDAHGVEHHTVVLDPPHPSSAFRAYASAEQGITAWVHRFERYIAKSPELADAMNKGDAHTFASILKAKFGYYTGNEADYGKNVERHAKAIRAQVPDA
jgi:hypothetical protein